MKVLQINSVCGVGSTGRIATDLHKSLVDKGHESIIAFGRGEPLNCDNAIRIGTRLDNYTHVLKTRVFDGHGLGSAYATRKFIEQLDDIHPDLIHLQNIHGYYINIEILFEYLKTANIPVVWTLHDCWSFTGHCAHFDYIGCDRWKDGCYDCPQTGNYPTSIVLDASKGNYMIKKKAFTGVKNLTLISPSRWLAELVRQSFLQDYPVKVINNGIDLNVFKPTESTFRQKYGLQEKTIVLGVANVWEERKGFDYFMQLANLLDAKFQIVMVGLTEKEKKGLPKNIIGITRTKSAKELAEIYTAADVFVNPTLEDNFPTTNLEALACGTPVITFDTGGSPEALDEEYGFVVRSGDIQGVKRDIETICHVGKKKYSERCLRRAGDRFGKNERIADYLHLYADIAEPRSRIRYGSN